MSLSLKSLKTPFLSGTKLYHRLRAGDDGIAVVDADWDTLVILDACRYDMFERLNNLPGSLSQRRSLGSATDEFIEANFTEKEYHDIVYVTANPRVNRYVEGSFHDIINVWVDTWDDDLGTVLPDAVADATQRAQSEYPNKRIVSHFVQPHAPFIGEFARENLPTHSTMSDHRPDDNAESASRKNIWTLLREGTVDRETVLEAYDENLQVALPHVCRIIESEPGKTVVTADHGNLIGERVRPFMRRMYGHPAGLYADSLIRVPWLEVNGSDRREIMAETPEIDDVPELTEDVERKLEDLGYV